MADDGMTPMHLTTANDNEEPSSPLQIEDGTLGSLWQVVWWTDAGWAHVADRFGLPADMGAGPVLPVSATASAYRLAPGRVWTRGLTPDDLAPVLSRLDPGLCATVDLSATRDVVRVSGVHAEALMARLVSPDCACAAFPISTFIVTALHGVSVLVERRAAMTFEIWLPKTWAPNLGAYIADVAAPLNGLHT